jgi:hypothetical protein
MLKKYLACIEKTKFSTRLLLKQQGKENNYKLPH